MYYYHPLFDWFLCLMQYSCVKLQLEEGGLLSPVRVLCRLYQELVSSGRPDSLCRRTKSQWRNDCFSKQVIMMQNLDIMITR